MGLMDTLRNALSLARPQASSSLSIDDWVSYFTFNGLMYPAGLNQTLVGNQEPIGQDFAGLVAGAYRSNGVIFACELVRILLFSEARFQFQTLRNGRPDELFGTPALAILEKPWPGGTTGDLLTRMLIHADFAGSAFVVRRNGRLRLLRPDWMTIVVGSLNDPDLTSDDVDAEVVGYGYQPGGPGSNREPVAFRREDVAHFAPVPDPLFRYRGISWLTPVIREVMADTAATTHKLKFFENGATPSMIVRFDPTIDVGKARQWVEFMEQNHKGYLNAYKTLTIGGGADATVVGANFRQMDFKLTQGAGETRIAAAAGVPPVIVGLSEGLQAATYSNYGQARRRLADGTMRPLWRNVAGSLEVIVPPPGGSRLWYDDRDIPFLAEDVKDRAEVLSLHAQTVKALTDAGFSSESVVRAVTAGDLSLLSHTGLFSVQLQPPGAESLPSEAEATERMVAWARAYLERPTPALLTAGDQAAEVRCSGCSKLLAERATPPYRILCPRCKLIAELPG